MWLQKSNCVRSTQPCAGLVKYEANTLIKAGKNLYQKKDLSCPRPLQKAIYLFLTQF